MADTTEFKLHRVETRARPARARDDRQRRGLTRSRRCSAAARSSRSSGVARRARARRLGGDGAHRQAVRLRGRRRHRRVPASCAPRARARRRPRRARALRPHPRAAVPDRRRDQRRLPRRRGRDRAALHCAHDLDRRAPLRLPRGLPRDHPRLGRHAADPAARRRRERGQLRSSRTRCARTGCSTRRKAFELGFADGLLEPVEFLDESIAFAARARRGRRSKRSRPPISSTSTEVCRKARSQVDDAVHGAAPAPYLALDLIEGAGDAGRSRRATAPRRRRSPSCSRAAGAGLALRVRRRRAAREARRRHARRRAAQRREGRHRRRRPDGDAARDAVPAPARGAGRDPRPRQERVDDALAGSAASSPSSSPRAARRGQGALPRSLVTGGDRLGRASPAATSCSRPSSRSWRSSSRSSPS